MSETIAVGNPGNVRIRELNSIQIKEKQGLTAFATSHLVKLVQRGDDPAGYFADIAVRVAPTDYSLYEIGNVIGGMSGLDKVNGAGVALEVFRTNLPERRYLEAAEYINNALVRRGEKAIELPPMHKTPDLPAATLVEPPEVVIDQRVQLNDGKDWRYDRIGERGEVRIGDPMFSTKVVTRLYVGINQGSILTDIYGLSHVAINQGRIIAGNPVSVYRMDGELEIQSAAAYVAGFGPAAHVSFESGKKTYDQNPTYYESGQLYLPADLVAIAQQGKYGLGAHPENVYILPQLSDVDFNNINNESSLQERYVTYRHGERVFLFAMAKGINGENWGIAVFEIPQNTDGTRDMSKAELVLGRKVTKSVIPEGFLSWFKTNTSFAVPSEQEDELEHIISPLVADVSKSESILPKPFKVVERIYTPAKRIGGGKYSEVYLATSPDGQQVVIKVANPVLSTLEGQNFDDERITLMDLETYQRDHGFLINGNALTPHFLGGGKTEEGRDFFIMTQAEGGGIGSLVKAEEIKYEDVIAIASQLCMVFESLHNGVRRGDLDFQGGNIFWDNIHRKITVIDWNLLTPSFDSSGVNAQALRGNDIYEIGRVLYSLSVKDSSPFVSAVKTTPAKVGREKIEAGFRKIPTDNPLREVIIKSLLTHSVISDVLQVADSDKYSRVEAMRAEIEEVSAGTSKSLLSETASPGITNEPTENTFASKLADKLRDSPGFVEAIKTLNPIDGIDSWLKLAPLGIQAREFDLVTTEARRLLMELRTFDGRVKEFLPIMETLVAADPSNADGLRFLGDIYMRLGKFQQAIDTYNKALWVR